MTPSDSGPFMLPQIHMRSSMQNSPFGGGNGKKFLNMSMAKNKMRQSMQTMDLKDARTTATLRANSMIAGGPTNVMG